jgi:hypothetical protein
MGFMNCALESWAIHVCVTIVFFFEKKIGIRHHNHRGPCLKYNVLLGVNYESDILVFRAELPKLFHSSPPRALSIAWDPKVAHSPAGLLTTSDAESPFLADSFDLSPSHFRAGSASKSRLLPGGGECH